MKLQLRKEKEKENRTVSISHQQAQIIQHDACAHLAIP